MVDLVEHDMVDFDFILGMDWLNSCFATIDCKPLVVKFKFSHEHVLELKGELNPYRSYYFVT